MAALERTDTKSRFERMVAHLTGTIGLKVEKRAREYAAELAEQGFDTPEDFDEIPLEDLTTDIKFKKGDLLKVERYRAKLAPAPEPEPDDALGDPLGAQLSDGSTVELGEVIGRGGQGVVKAATITHADGKKSKAAVKLLAQGASERDQQKIGKEITIAMRAAEKCRGVCESYGQVMLEGCVGLVMKRYSCSLEQLLNENEPRVPLPFAHALGFGLQVAQALADLHAENVTVQDLKPANLLLDEVGALVVADFGIAALTETLASQSRTGAGTPMYQAYEQFDPDTFGPVTVQTDVWAWACIMVEMLTGKLPWPKPDGTAARQQEIMTNIVVKQKTPELPLVCRPAIVQLLTRCFSHDQTQRPTSKDLVDALQPFANYQLVLRGPGTDAYRFAISALENSWDKRDVYEFNHVDKVEEIVNPTLRARYTAYQAKLAATPPTGHDGNECLLFHGCSPENQDSICATGFLKSKQKSSSGPWQRFGPGFYFALHSSKSHEYPLKEMEAKAPGQLHQRQLLLCQVARGRVFKTESNIASLTGEAPTGYDSVNGQASVAGPMNYPELVVFDEAAVLPYAIVTYTFFKKVVGAAAATAGGSGPPPSAAAAAGGGGGASAGVPNMGTRTKVAVLGMGPHGSNVAASFALAGCAVQAYGTKQLPDGAWGDATGPETKLLMAQKLMEIEQEHFSRSAAAAAGGGGASRCSKGRGSRSERRQEHTSFRQS